MVLDNRVVVYSSNMILKDKKKISCPNPRLIKNINLKHQSYRLSPYVFLYENKDFFCIYHSINMKKIYGDERLKKFFNLGKEKEATGLNEFQKILGENNDGKEALKLLQETEILIPQHYDSSLPLKRLKGCSLFFKPHISIFYFLATNTCNLQCKYCAIESDFKKPKRFKFKHMNFLIAKKGVELFAKAMDKTTVEPTIIFYGGEPLLNWGAVKKTIQYIRHRESEGAFAGKKIQLQMVTNGTLIDKEKVKFMKKHELSPSVSIDGLQHHHDAMRVLRDTQKGSWKDTSKGYMLLKEAFGSVSVSCTLGLHNNKDLEEIAEYFATELELRGLGINLYKGLPTGSDIELDAKGATLMLIRAYKIFRRFGIYEDRIMRKIKAFVVEKPWLADCGGYGGQLALNVDGYLGPCQIMADNNQELIGHIDDKDIVEKVFNSEIMKRWCQRSPVNMEQCFDCEAIAVCGGGCVDEVLAKGGGFWDIDAQFCEHTKTTLEWMIKDLGEAIYGKK